MKTQVYCKGKILLSITMMLLIMVSIALGVVPITAHAQGYELSSSEKAGLRTAIYQAIESMESLGSVLVNISDLNIPYAAGNGASQSIKDEYNTYIEEHPEWFWLSGVVGFFSETDPVNSGGQRYKTMALYLYSSITSWQDLLEMKQLFQIAADAALSAVPNGANVSDLDKVIGAHEYLAYATKYDALSYARYLQGLSVDNEMIHTAYGAFVERTAVCGGFSKAFMYLMQQIGVECKIVAGIGGSGAHAWNIVKVGDKWYHVDTTWDASSIMGRVEHKYLLVSDSSFRFSAGRTAHSWDMAIQAPDLSESNMDDTTYESLFFTNNATADINTKLMYNENNGRWYYIQNNKLMSYDISTAIATTVISNWINWSGAPNYGGATYPGDYNGQIYYNEKTNIYRINFDGTEKITVTSASDSANPPLSIVEMKVVGSILEYKVKYALNDFNLYTINLYVPVADINLNKSSASLNIGGTDLLEATVSPDNATDPNVSWSSSNTNVATVDAVGVVSAVGNGSAAITATSAADSTKFATCMVSVSPYVETSLYEGEQWLIELTEVAIGKSISLATPVDLAAITTLNLLNASTHRATATKLPAAIGFYSGLTNLTLNGLYSPDFTAVNAVIGNLNSLTSLTITGTQVASLPDEIAALTALTRLDISYNPMLIALPVSVNSASAFPYLASLSLSGNALDRLPVNLMQARDLALPGSYYYQKRVFPDPFEVAQGVNAVFEAQILADVWTLKGMTCQLTVSFNGGSSLPSGFASNGTISLLTSRFPPGNYTAVINLVAPNYKFGNFYVDRPTLATYTYSFVVT